MSIRVALLRKITEMDPNIREAILLLLEEMERQREHLEQQVTKTEFNELKAVVAELAEAQRQTQAEVRALAEALKETQAEVRALAEAQKRTEQRLDRLEQVVAELAEAQKRTEEELQALIRRVDLLHERVEGLSNTVGYTLENQAYRYLPRILRTQLGIQVEGRLLRRYVSIQGTYRQVNIYGIGRRNGQRFLIVGEAKTRPSQREVDKFLRLVQNLEKQEGLPVIPIFVAHDFHPTVENYMKEKGVLPVWSYDLEPPEER